MSIERPRRLWGGASELADLLEGMPGGMDVAVRDFALITLAGQLSACFPRQLVFKGGFVLRHVHGLLRFSKDVDATRHEPPEHKLDGKEVAEAIRQASIRNIVRFFPDEPATNSARSLDFNNVQVIGETFPSSSVQVEVSYREAVVDNPVRTYIGEPFYEEFEILTMAAERRETPGDTDAPKGPGGRAASHRPVRTRRPSSSEDGLATGIKGSLLDSLPIPSRRRPVTD